MANLEVYINEIKISLQKQNQLIKELIQINSSQIEALQKDDIETINYTASEQERLGRELALEERKRREIVFKLGRQYNNENIKMSDIYKLVSDSEARVLRDLSNKIIANHTKLQELNETAKLLLKQSMHYVQKILNILDPSSNKTYSSNGRIERTDNPSILNRSV